MFATASKKLLSTAVSATATATARARMSTKVTVLGAGGGIGQPLSMLLKLSTEIDELACYDIVGAPGVAADLSHVSCIYIYAFIHVRAFVYVCVAGGAAAVVMCCGGFD